MTRTRAIRRRRVVAAAVVAVALAVVATRLLTSTSASFTNATTTLLSTLTRREDDGGGGDHGGLGEADGAVPDGTTLFSGDVPGVARLRPAFLRALRAAATDAGRDGVRFTVNSGWRSAAYEDRLRQEAVAKYGSEEAAARWVATGTTSPHVLGEAVDLGPVGAVPWLAAHGAVYGLCRIYANEPWHFELRPAAVTQGCPALYADPTQDPRMRK